ncbi:syntaxin-3, putative [Entamoeba invadens IP1]|uniref:Syntaxin-3, putative n=1 Tax=Entamoeba invadens IP1 TaxID=370355 RepID=A0A0A1TUU8_ENTIV|nr:syntaxin-3, putative [Entamoeba invadens IP1]ELP83914.1 syntaxin-3, putative [Entamoeba invadens IP1]|eukprot:XP_004183260.1 syntaxin-3, putative [Entamoeba invadens IP1]
MPNELPVELTSFLDVVHELRVKLYKLKLQVKVLSEKNKFIALGKEGDEESSSNDSVQMLITKISQDAIAFENRLKKLREQNDTLKTQNERGEIQLSDTILRIRTNHTKSLSSQFVKLMRSCQDIQLEIKVSIKQKVCHKIKIFHPEFEDEAIEKVIDTEKVDDGVVERLRKTTNQPTVDYLTKRHQELVEINNAINGVSEMFVSISVLLGMQGELIDSIEQNCDQTKEYSATINQELERTYHLKKKLVAKIVVLSIILVVIVVLIVCAITIPIAVYFTKDKVV